MSWQREIVDLHDFFEAWLGGRLPDTDAAFARLTDALDPVFTMVTPQGGWLERAPLVEGLRHGHGSRPGLAIAIEDPHLRHDLGSHLVATYVERQDIGGETTRRLSTVILARDPAGPNGVRWVHVHETWAVPS